jgi:thioredoxin 1
VVGLKSIVVAFVAVLLVAAVQAPLASPKEMPYDESADARADIAAALARARDEGKAVLLTFGANWCRDCRVLGSAMATPPLADAIAARFVVVDIDVGNWDKNLDVAHAWGNPIAKGIPSIVVADARGTVLYATKAGELANARRMGSDAFVKFFTRLPTAVQ